MGRRNRVRAGRRGGGTARARRARRAGPPPTAARTPPHHPRAGTLAAKINWRVPLDAEGRFSPRSTVQTFVPSPESPSILLNHGNEYLHYQDDWYIMGSKKDAYVVVYYRGKNDAWDGYGGAVVYTRDPKFPVKYKDEIAAALKGAGVEWSDMTLTDNTCKAQPPPRPTLTQELAADVVAVESELAKDLAAVEGELAKGVTAAERALAADAALLEGDALAAARSLAARTSDLGRAAARVPGRVSAAAAEELAQVECEASDAARFLARVEKEYLETPLQKVARRLGLAK